MEVVNEMNLQRLFEMQAQLDADIAYTQKNMINHKRQADGY